MLGRILNIPISLKMLLSLHRYFRFYSRLIQAYSSIIQEHTHAYSEPCVSLVFSKPWQIPITKHIQTPKHFHNTVLNIFTKAQSWAFNTTVMHLSSIDARVTLRHLQTHSSKFKSYSPIFILVKAYSC